MDDPDIDRLLRNSHPRIGFPPDFQRAVWARIGAESASVPFPAFPAWLLRPLPAAAAAAITIALGAVLGRLSLPDRPDGLREYAQAVSPVVAVRNHVP